MFDISFGTLELQRSDPAHLGTAPLSTSSIGAVPEEAGRTKGAFESYLLEAVESLNGKQVEVNKLQEKLITEPDSVDIHDVTIAVAKAKMSLNLAQTVIDRVVSGWTNLSQNK